MAGIAYMVTLHQRCDVVEKSGIKIKYDNRGIKIKMTTSNTRTIILT